MSLQSINPYNQEIIQTYQEHPEETIDQKIEAANHCFKSYKKTLFSERKQWMLNLKQQLLERKEEWALIATQEMGKPLKDAIAEVEKCASVCAYYAEHAALFLQDEEVETEASHSFVTCQPLGVILAVMPWNFPYWQAFRFLAPALMAGNVALLKHASNVTGCALAIEKMVHEAGFPPHSFQTLVISSKKVEYIIRHPLVKAVTLTGSTQAGQQVAQLAGSLIKKTVLELGGSDPYIILEDADIKNAAVSCAASRLINNGQSCIAAKRFIVLKSVAQQFIAHLKVEMESKKWGNPMDSSTDLGPMARLDLRDELHKQVLNSVEKGAKCILGGKIPQGNAVYYPPTILTEVNKGMPAYDEEMFGPVASVIMVENEEEAIKAANDTSFGLGAAVFTKDLRKGEKIAREELEAGSCFVNTFVKSDPRLPFGGINLSGYGRELGQQGIKEFVNIKTVYVK